MPCGTRTRIPRNPHNDLLERSNGHAAPVLGVVWAQSSAVCAEADSLPEAPNLSKISSDLDGNPVPKLAFTHVATASLDQVLWAASRMAYMGKNLAKLAERWRAVAGLRVGGHGLRPL